MTGFQAYSLYNSIRLHFTQQGYNAFAYNFKSNVRMQSFERRKDRYFFERIAKKFVKEDDLKMYFADNIMAENMWIGEMEMESHTTRDTYRQSMFYNFQRETKLIRERAYKYNLTFDGVCKANSDKTDNLLLNLFMSQQISPETVAIIDHFVKFIKSLKSELNDPLGIVKGTLLTLEKYQQFIIPLIVSDENKYRNQLIMLFTNEPNQYNIEFVGSNNTTQY